MKKLCVGLALVLLSMMSNAQIALTKYTGKEASKFGLGYGLFIKGGYSFNAIDDVTLEAGANTFGEKEDSKYGIFNIPIKLGYRYKLSRKDYGLYVEPQVGYNVYGGRSMYNEDTYETIELKYNGLMLSPGFGYLLERKGGFQANFELRYDINVTPTGPYSWMSFRFTHNFSFGKRD